MADPCRTAKNPTIPVVVRMPADLHEAIKARAAADERSMAQAIRYALRLYVATPSEGGG